MKCFHPALSSFTPFHTQNIFCQTSCQPDWWPVYKNCRECYITTFQWRILDKLLFFFLCFLKISLRPSLNGQTVFLKAFPPHWCTNSHQISVCNVIKMWTALHDVFFLYAVFFQFLFFVANFTLWFLSDITVNSVPSEEVHYWSIDDVSAADPFLGPSSSTHCTVGSTALYTDLRTELRTRFSSSYHFLVVKHLGLLGLK